MKIKTTGPKQPRIQSTTATQPRVEPRDVAMALGATKARGLRRADFVKLILAACESDAGLAAELQRALCALVRRMGGTREQWVSASGRVWDSLDELAPRGRA